MAVDERSFEDQSAPDGAASWSAVLAAVEADMARTAQLMATSADSVHPGDGVGAPAQAMLPATFRHYAEASWATLPALEEMPPVPPEMLERIHTLRAQIVAIQAEIKSEMARWRSSCAAGRPASTPGPTAEPLFVDRLA